MKIWLLTLGLLFAFETSEARAQMTVDVAKITCRQYLLDKVASTKSVAIWLSGYYNGRRNNTVIDIGTVERNADKVQSFCSMNLDVTVMDAVKGVLGVDK